jgi:aldehyde:ferredoxin oxidoreductase
MSAYNNDNTIEVFNAVTGLSLDYNKALLTGERIFNLKKAFNVQHGATKEEDKLPKRLLTEITKSGVVNKLPEMINEYYSIRGWDKNSRLTPEKIRELEL